MTSNNAVLGFTAVRIFQSFFPPTYVIHFPRIHPWPGEGAHTRTTGMDGPGHMGKGRGLTRLTCHLELGNKTPRCWPSFFYRLPPIRPYKLENSRNT